MNAPDLRIAFVTGTLQLGGSTTFLCNLAGELIKRGVSCRVFGDDSLHPLAKDFERLRVPVSLQNRRCKIFEDRIAGVLGELSDYKPSVVVATIAPFAFEILRYTPRDLMRIAMIQADDPLVYRTVEKYTDFMDGVVGVSAVIVRRLEEMDSFRRVAKHQLPYGVPMPAQPVEPARVGEPLRILYLGRVTNEQKRVYLFPQIVVSLERAGIVSRWTIAGDGPDRVALQARLKSAAPTSRVEFVGAVNYADVGRVLAAHNILILVSDYEGLPLSLLEAMGHGLVPVVSDLESGIREVVTENNGMLVPVNDTEAYARAIAYLHKNRDELAAKSAAARERARTEFSVGAMADRWMHILSTASNKSAEWPDKWRVGAPLIDPRNLRYASGVRWLRRWLLKVSRFGL